MGPSVGSGRPRNKVENWRMDVPRNKVENGCAAEQGGEWMCCSHKAVVSLGGS